MPKKSNREEFIERSEKRYGKGRYDYSKVEYKNAHTKVTIICHVIDKITGEEHGEFEQKPYSHLNGHECPKCKGGVQLNSERFILQARYVHGDKFDYSKVKYVNANTKVTIICRDCGCEFEQKAYVHLDGHGCPSPTCAKNVKSNSEEWVARATAERGDDYDYSNVNYVNNKTPVTIICRKCGRVFSQTPDKHLNYHQNCSCYRTRRAAVLSHTGKKK